MKAIQFHPEAEQEMVDAAAYYDSQRAGLGKRFLASVQDAVSRIRANPGQYQIVEDDVRRCLTHTFPYGVLFQRRGDQCVVIAVMHLHRDPGYWKQRVPLP